MAFILQQICVHLLVFAVAPSFATCVHLLVFAVASSSADVQVVRVCSHGGSRNAHTGTWLFCSLPIC